MLLVLCTYYADLQKSDNILDLFKLRRSTISQPHNEDQREFYDNFIEEKDEQNKEEDEQLRQSQVKGHTILYVRLSLN